MAAYKKLLFVGAIISLCMIEAASLIEAVKSGNMGKVRMLLAQPGININALDDDGCTALMWAIKTCRPDMIETLVVHGAKADIQDKNGNTAPLLAGSCDGNVGDEIDMIFMGRQSLMRTSALIQAIANNDQREVAALLARPETNMNAQDDNGNTALMIAAAGAQEEIVRLLIAHGANVEIQNNKGINALITAVIAGYKNIVELLIPKRNHRAATARMVNAKDNNGVTALMVASENGERDIAELLIQSGARINEVDKHGRTALMAAASKDHAGIAELLVKKGANAVLLNKDGTSALSIARKRGNAQIVALLEKTTEAFVFPFLKNAKEPETTMTKKQFLHHLQDFAENNPKHIQNVQNFKKLLFLWNPATYKGNRDFAEEVTNLINRANAGVANS